MPIDNLRGKVHKVASSEIPCIATYHPADILREPSQKKLVWEDLLLAKSVVTESSGGQVSQT